MLSVTPEQTAILLEMKGRGAARPIREANRDWYPGSKARQCG